MSKKKRIKIWLLAVAFLIIILVSIISPEHTETVAKAFVMLFGVVI